MGILQDLIAMSVSKRDAELALHDNLPQIVLHIIKITAIENSAQYKEGWENEIDNWLYAIYNKITNIKTKARKLSMSQIKRQVADCRELEFARLDRIKTQIRVKWEQKGQPPQFKALDYEKLFSDISSLLNIIFKDMIDDRWEFTIRSQAEYKELVESCM